MRFTRLNRTSKFDHAVYLHIAPFLNAVAISFLVASLLWPEGLGFQTRGQVWTLFAYTAINVGYNTWMFFREDIPLWVSRTRVFASALALAAVYFFVDPSQTSMWVLLLLPFLGQVTSSNSGFEFKLRFWVYVAVMAFAYGFHFTPNAVVPWFCKAFTAVVSIFGITGCAWAVRRYDRHQRISLLAAYNKLSEKQTSLIRMQRFAAIGELSSGIAHEVNNALVILIGGVDEVEHHVPETDQNRAVIVKNVERMRRGVARIQRITAQVRSLARDFTKEPITIFDLRLSVDDSLFLVRNQLASRGIVWEAILPEAPLLVAGHPGEVAQVLINLINNARDALEEAKAKDSKITLRAYRDGIKVVVEVIDTGPGVPPEVQSKLFNQFVTTKADGKGSGLGLSISRDIIKRHQGTISFRSNGGGAVFILELPLASEAVAA